jgi:DNA replicative helicase MCM subunit Mcm2 (Cdc46/Mcm family)
MRVYPVNYNRIAPTAYDEKNCKRQKTERIDHLSNHPHLVLRSSMTVYPEIHGHDKSIPNKIFKKGVS